MASTAVVVILHGDTGSVPNEPSDAVDVAVAGGVHQCRASVGVAQIRRSPATHQQLHHRRVAFNHSASTGKET